MDRRKKNARCVSIVAVAVAIVWSAACPHSTATKRTVLFIFTCFLLWQLRLFDGDRRPTPTA